MTLNSGWTYREQVGPEGDGLTVLDYPRRHASSLDQRRMGASASSAAKWKSTASAWAAAAILRPGQTIAWHRPPWDEGEVPTNYTIVHEDESIIAVDKPGGLPTMPAGGYLNHTLLTLMREKYPETSPLHRLGRHTSGTGVVRAQRARRRRSWRGRGAITPSRRPTARSALGETRTEMFVIDVPIGPVPHPLLGTVEAACEEGKPSHSVAMVLEGGLDRTLFQVDITTGRPHQVRIHLAYAGHPLIGDPLYEAGGGLKRASGTARRRRVSLCTPSGCSLRIPPPASA